MPGFWIQASPSTCTGIPSSPIIVITTSWHYQKRRERTKRKKMRKVLWANLVLVTVWVCIWRDTGRIYEPDHSREVDHVLPMSLLCFWSLSPLSSPPNCLTDCLLPLPRNSYNQVIARLAAHPWTEGRHFLPFSFAQPSLTWVIRWWFMLTRRDTAICIEPKIATTSSFPSSIAGASYS